MTPTVEQLKRSCAGTAIHVLDSDEVTIDGVRFLAATLWTDFMLFGEGEKRAQAMEKAHRFMRDFLSDADGRHVCVWIHVHTHDSFDYCVNGTRILCNPRGYAKNGVNEIRCSIRICWSKFDWRASITADARHRLSGSSRRGDALRALMAQANLRRDASARLRDGARLSLALGWLVRQPLRSEFTNGWQENGFGTDR